MATRLVLTCLLLLAPFVAPASAQAPTASPAVTELPEPLLLHQGERAPFEGQLILQDDLLRWAQQIETLRHQLDLDVSTEHTRCDVRLQLEEARTNAAGAQLELHERLWTARTQELATAVTEARASAVRQWWENPALWFVIGVVVTAGVMGVLAAVIGH